MTTTVEAAVLTATCSRTHRPFGIRVQRTAPREWSMTWSFRIEPGVAGREGYADAQTLSGRFVWGSDYPGCPHCQTRSLYQCSCKRLACHDGEVSQTCPVCGTQVQLEGTVETISALSDH